MSSTPEIPYGVITQRFESHVSNPLNKRLLLSGKFGTGKSTFIRDFFKNREETYATIRINPVCYSVNSNDDIFDIIKADILLQFYMLGLDKPVELEKLSGAKIWKEYVRQHPLSFTTHIAGALAKVLPFAEPISGVIDAVDKLVKDVGDFEKKINIKNKPDARKATELVERVYNSSSSVWENTAVAGYIGNIISGVQKDNRQVVLLVDDLDRLDPEHIFRILNIFSAHMESDTDENKFGFDKIILVCDVENIKNIYAHRYGEKVDFNGYIDKFLSEEVFEFSIADTLTEYCRTFSGISDPNARVVLQVLLTALVESGELSIRGIKRYTFSGFNPFTVIKFPVDNEVSRRLKNTPYFGLSHFVISSEDIGLMEVVKLMSAMFGSLEQLILSLSKVGRSGEVNNETMERIAIAMYLPILLNRQNVIEVFFQRYGKTRGGELSIDINSVSLTVGNQQVSLVVNSARIREEQESDGYSWFSCAEYKVYPSAGSPWTVDTLASQVVDFCRLVRKKQYARHMNIASSS